MIFRKQIRQLYTGHPVSHGTILNSIDNDCEEPPTISDIILYSENNESRQASSETFFILASALHYARRSRKQLQNISIKLKSWAFAT